MSGGRVMRPLLALAALYLVQAVVQIAPHGHEQEGVDMDDLAGLWGNWWPVVVALVVSVLVIGLAAWKDGSKNLFPMGPGFSPTLPLVVPVFTLSLVALLWVDGTKFSDREALRMALLIALMAWVLAACWRGNRSTARGVAPEEYERLRSEHQALSNAYVPPVPGTDGERTAAVPLADVPPATDGPLAADRIDAFLLSAAKDIGFVGDGKSGLVSGAAWNSGTGYLEIGRRFDLVRTSLLAHERDKAKLESQANALALRLAGANLQREQYALLTKQLETATAQIAQSTNDDERAVPAAAMYQIAAALSFYTYVRQREMLQLRSQQHWLVVTVQLVAAVLLALAVLSNASKEAVTAAVAFSLVGSISGMISLLHVRSSIDGAKLGDDYGLFRVELARAFTLSGMAAVMAVFVMANLPVLSESGDVFDPATPTPTEPTETAPAETPTVEVEATDPANAPTAEATAVAWSGEGRFVMRAQDATSTATTDATTDNATDEPEAWRSLGSIYGFANVGGWLIALLAGWVPERLFRTLTDKGNRLRMDIQSVSTHG